MQGRGLTTHLDAKPHRLVGGGDPSVPHGIHLGQVLLDVLEPDAGSQKPALLRASQRQ